MRNIIVKNGNDVIFTMEDQWDNVDKPTVLEIVRCFVGLSGVITIDERTPKERKEDE